MTAINELNIPLFDNDAEYFLEESYFDGENRAVIVGGCNRKGNAIDVTLVRDSSTAKWRLFIAQAKRRTGKNSVSFVDMGAAQERRLRSQLAKIGIIE